MYFFLSFYVEGEARLDYAEGRQGPKI